MERGNGPRQDRLVSLWPRMTAVGSVVNPLQVPWKNLVGKSGIPVQGPKGTLIISGAIEKMQVEEFTLHVDTSVKIIKLNQIN